jgi:hypothetical protein
MAQANPDFFRLRWSLPVVLPVLFWLLTSPLPAFADGGCSRENDYARSTATQNAYGDYNEEMRRIQEKFSTDINLAFRETDLNERQKKYFGTYEDYYSNLRRADRDMADRLNRINAGYQNQNSFCIPYYQPYQYGYNPYNYNNYNYYQQSNYYQPSLPPASPGCGYDCYRERGRQVCYRRCRNYYPATCNCTQDFAPVCGKDNLSYTNACFASCANMTVKYTGMCEE